jgi:transglutaminase-like putative cysteine protease
MLYDIRLKLDYAYDTPVSGGRHLVRVSPRAIPDKQRLIAASVTFDPEPAEQSGWTDFFGNSVLSIGHGKSHKNFQVSMNARASVEGDQSSLDVSPNIAGLRSELDATLSVAPESPHHFTAPSPRVPDDEDISAFSAQSLTRTGTVREAAMDLCLAIHDTFTYDASATNVSTTARWTFENRRGVCQDFAHVMIAGLRGIGIPAGYVSGFLRTLPPPGGAKLEGADAMHAWVRAWCGQQTGWLEFDPTNAIMTGTDHITIGYGRDYSDVTPIVGVFRSVGGHRTTQSVDVIAVE